MRATGIRPTVLQRAVALLARSWRLEIAGEQHVRALRSRGTPIVFAVWHAQLLAPLWHRRGEGITVLVSRHTDGGYLAGAAMAWGYGAVRGSSSCGGVPATRAIIRVLEEGGDVAFTPDGPRGPARTVKRGAVAVARRAGAAIVPVGVHAGAAWRLRSWDRFEIPRLGARVRIEYGAPVPVGASSLAEDAERLERALKRLGGDEEC